jgi:hypothetical protein
VDFVKQLVKCLLLLEMKPPRWARVFRRAPKLVVSHGKFVKVTIILPPQGKKSR